MSRFIPPTQSPHFIAFLKFFCPAVLKIRRNIEHINVTADALDRFHQLREQRTVICPNHPDPADGETLFAFSKIVGENFYYLTAREMFRTHHGFSEWFLRQAGCYSIRRGTADYESYKTTRDIIAEGKSKLVVFPEAEISHRGDFLLPIEPGIVQMSFWAVDSLQKSGNPAPVYLLPTALKYTYVQDIRSVLEMSLTRIESCLGLGSDKQDLKTRVQKTIAVLLSALEDSYGFNDQPSPLLADRLFQLRSNILQRAADSMGILLPPGDTHANWARILGGSLNKLRYDTEPEPFGYYHQIHSEKLDRANCCMRDLRKVINFLMFDAALDGPLGQEDLAEVINGLEREVFRKSNIFGKRQVFIDVGTPIDVNDSYAMYKSSKVNTVSELNETLTMNLSEMIKRLDLEHTETWITEPFRHDTENSSISG